MAEIESNERGPDNENCEPYQAGPSFDDGFTPRLFARNPVFAFNQHGRFLPRQTLEAKP